MIKFAMTPHKYALNEIEERALLLNKEKIRMFIDLRNSIPVFFDENATKLLLKDPKLSILQFVDSVLLFMDYISHIFTQLPVEFIFFYEKGRSEYHKSLNKEYKSNRQGAYLILSPDEVEKAKDLNIKCFDALYSMFENFSGIGVFKLNYFEADFIPHYIINVLDDMYENNTRYFNVILSNDKDMFQTNKSDLSTVCLRKEYRKKATSVIDFNNMYSELIKDKDAIIENTDKNFIADILALSGDESDGVKGIKGIGYKTAFNIFKHIQLRLNEIYNKYESFEDLEKDFDKLPTRTKTAIKKIFDNKDHVENNLKQVDYDIIKEHIPFKTLKEIKEAYERLHDTKLKDVDKIVDDLLLFENDYSGLITKLFGKMENFQELIDQYESRKGQKKSVFDKYVQNNVGGTGEDKLNQVLFNQQNNPDLGALLG